MKRPTGREIFTIPNIMGYLRIILIPVFCYFYITAESLTDYLIAAVIVGISSLSDLFDGMIARKFNQVTELGKALDPIADKLTHGALAICIATHYPLMWALIVLMVIKEGYMAIMGLYFIRRGTMLDGAMWFGKVCTASLFVGMLILFLFPYLPQGAVIAIVSVLMVIMVMTLLMYVPVFRKMKMDLKEKDGEE